MKRAASRVGTRKEIKIKFWACLCGYIPRHSADKRDHDKVCPTWKNRPDPKGLKEYRSRETIKERKFSIVTCIECKRSMTNHTYECSYSSFQIQRENLIKSDFNQAELLIAALEQKAEQKEFQITPEYDPENPPW